MIKQSQSPYGYKNLLVFKKAEELQLSCTALTGVFPKIKTLIALADQMNRSARSVKQNIVEGWKRNSTKEYYEFLGFSIGANAELEEDCMDIWKGIYPDLKGKMGVTGERGTHSTPSTSSSLLAHFTPLSLSDIEKLPFYPLDSSLPPVVRLKLRCKELNFLLSKLQKSLEDKMTAEHTLSTADRFKKSQINQHKNKDWYEKTLADQGFARMENGLIVKKEQE